MMMVLMQTLQLNQLDQMQCFILIHNDRVGIGTGGQQTNLEVKILPFLRLEETTSGGSKENGNWCGW